MRCAVAQSEELRCAICCSVLITSKGVVIAAAIAPAPPAANMLARITSAGDRWCSGGARCLRTGSVIDQKRAVKGTSRNNCTNADHVRQSSCASWLGGHQSIGDSRPKRAASNTGTHRSVQAPPPIELRRPPPRACGAMLRAGPRRRPCSPACLRDRRARHEARAQHLERRHAGHRHRARNCTGYERRGAADARLKAVAQTVVQRHVDAHHRHGRHQRGAQAHPQCAKAALRAGCRCRGGHGAAAIAIGALGSALRGYLLRHV